MEKNWHIVGMRDIAGIILKGDGYDYFIPSTQKEKIGF